MDRALQLAIRAYIASGSDEDAHRVARLLLKSQTDTGQPILSKTPHGYLTYAGLLQALAALDDEQLGQDVFYVNDLDEYFGVTDFLVAGPENPTVDPGQWFLTGLHCEVCNEPLPTERAIRHYEEPDLEDVCDECLENQENQDYQDYDD